MKSPEDKTHGKGKVRETPHNLKKKFIQKNKTPKHTTSSYKKKKQQHIVMGGDQTKTTLFMECPMGEGRRNTTTK